MLQEVYRRERLSALIHQREIAYVLSLLRAAGIEPVLVKGWAIARLYPDAALRPYGDIDLCIRPDQFAKANAALKCLEDIKGHYVDLHCGFARIGQTKPQDLGRDFRRFSRLRRLGNDKEAMREWDELFSRSQLVPLTASSVQSPTSNVRLPSPPRGEGLEERPAHPTRVRILCHEDHLRLLSLHLLRSGARRPPWLCDVALLLEAVQSPTSKVQSPIRTGSHSDRVWGSSPTIREGSTIVQNQGGTGNDFNWDVCLGSGVDRNTKRNLNWIAVTIGLAQQLLRAEVPEIANQALAERVRNLPRWLAPAVLSQWGRARAVGSRQSAVGSERPDRIAVKDSSDRPDRIAVKDSSRGLSVLRDTPGSVRENIYDPERVKEAAHRHWTLNFSRRWTLDFFSLWTRLDNPVRATAAVGGQFNNWPRLPYRAAELVTRLPEVPRQLVSLLEQFAARRQPVAISEARSVSLINTVASAR